MGLLTLPGHQVKYKKQVVPSLHIMDLRFLKLLEILHCY